MTENIKMTLREIAPADYPLLEDFLYHAIFIPPGEEPPPRDIIYNPDVFIYVKDFGSKTGDCGVVAEQDGTIVGTAWTRIIPAYGHIDDVTPELATSVLPKYRGRGIGTDLMTHLFELLRSQGYTRTSLAVQQRNAAVRFYKRLGYRTIRENDEEFIMVKELGVSLREWTIEDAPALAAALNNKKIHDNLRDGLPFPYTTKDAEDYINFVLSAEKDTQYVRAITYDGKVIGSIGVHRKDNIHRLTAEFGYYIAEPYWGKGIVSKAVKQICSYVFENTDIIRIFAEPYESNAASCRVLEKAGFQYEGTLRQNAVKNGKIIDMKLYALLKNDCNENGYYEAEG